MPELIDLETGEVVDTTTASPSSYVKTTSVTKYVGIDVKWPKDCLTVDHIRESISQLDAYINGKPHIDYPLLNEALMTKRLTQEEWTVLHWLCQSLAAWNYWIGDVSELDALPGGVRHRRAIAGLVEKGLLRVAHKDKPFRGNRVFHVHPAYGWRGGYFFQGQSIRTWMEDRTWKSVQK